MQGSDLDTPTTIISNPFHLYEMPASASHLIQNRSNSSEPIRSTGVARLVILSQYPPPIPSLATASSRAVASHTPVAAPCDTSVPKPGVKLKKRNVGFASTLKFFNPGIAGVVVKPGEKACATRPFSLPPTLAAASHRLCKSFAKTICMALVCPYRSTSSGPLSALTAASGAWKPGSRRFLTALREKAGAKSLT